MIEDVSLLYVDKNYNIEKLFYRQTMKPQYMKLKVIFRHFYSYTIVKSLGNGIN